MSAQVTYKQWTVVATGTSLADIIGTAEPKFVANFVVRAKSSNAGSIFWGGSDVTNVPANAGGEIKPGESVSFDPVSRYLHVGRIFFVGTAADVAYFTLVS